MNRPETNSLFNTNFVAGNPSSTPRLPMPSKPAPTRTTLMGKCSKRESFLTKEKQELLVKAQVHMSRDKIGGSGQRGKVYYRFVDELQETVRKSALYFTQQLIHWMLLQNVFLNGFLTPTALQKLARQGQVSVLTAIKFIRRLRYTKSFKLQQYQKTEDTRLDAKATGCCWKTT